MTDAADNLRSNFGPHVDFAAPGFKIYSTATGGGYAYGSGTSYSSSLFCGAMAALFSINPALSPDDAIDILKRTSVQLGRSPWNEYFGWGRINFAAAAATAQESRIAPSQWTNGAATVSGYLSPGLHYALWRTTQTNPPQWSPVTHAFIRANGNVVSFTDLHPISTNSYYRIAP
jgi:subtilisin family serine protease